MFKGPVSDWTQNQVRFCDWMMFYDSVYESDDRPSDDIISDNERIDQWFKNKVKEIEREREKYMRSKKGVGNRSAYDHHDVLEFD